MSVVSGETIPWRPSAKLCCASVNKQCGLGLLQTVVALMLLSLMLVLVLSRFQAVVEDANDARLKALASGFRAAVFLARETWFVRGLQQAGQHAGGSPGSSRSVWMSDSGWPQPGATAAPEVISHQGCALLWRHLLQNNAPTVMAVGADNGQQIEAGAIAEIQAEAVQGMCRYYLTDKLLGGGFSTPGSQRFIQYDPSSGRVTWQVR